MIVDTTMDIASSMRVTCEQVANGMTMEAVKLMGEATEAKVAVETERMRMVGANLIHQIVLRLLGKVFS